MFEDCAGSDLISDNRSRWISSIEMGNTFGQLFRVTTFGESHGGGIGAVVDGCPPGIDISEAHIQRELDRRRPGQSKLTTQRKEEDRCEILSGVFEGKTLGTPVMMMVRNKDLVNAVSGFRARRLCDASSRCRCEN